jgi:hypothetical protein
MRSGLADEWWMRMRDEPAENDGRLAAAGNLAVSLGAQGKHAEAEKMERELLDLQRRVLGLEHPHTLATMGNLARSMGGLGKHAEAAQMQRELLDVKRRVLGPEHADTDHDDQSCCLLRRPRQAH